MVEERYRSNWIKWHKERIRDLNKPHGWLSLVSQELLKEGIPTKLENIPGSWLLEQGKVIYVPDEDIQDTININGKPAFQQTTIPWGFNEYSIDGSAVPLIYKEFEIEAMVRQDGLERKLYFLRVRDSKFAFQRKIEEIPTFPLSNKWILPATFIPKERYKIAAKTVENNVFENFEYLGKVVVTFDSGKYSFTLLGNTTPDGVQGYLHIHDVTNGKETYGAGRFVEKNISDWVKDKTVDFNYLITFPCAITNYVTCPLPPKGNSVPFEITAGEKVLPKRINKRIQIFN